jgi:hypothetical protein
MQRLSIGLCALLISTAAASATPYTVTLEEEGTSVVAVGSGDIDISGLSIGAPTFGFNPAINPSTGFLYTGSAASPYSEFQYYLGMSGPSSFGTGGTTDASSGTGSIIGLYGYFGDLVLPYGYTSETPISVSATYDNATFASLGVTPGTYVWTWGTGPDQSFTLEIGATPLPAALPLFATGLGVMSLLGWRRKRKNAAALTHARSNY